MEHAGITSKSRRCGGRAAVDKKKEDADYDKWMKEVYPGIVAKHTEGERLRAAEEERRAADERRRAEAKKLRRLAKDVSHMGEGLVDDGSETVGHGEKWWRSEFNRQARQQYQNARDRWIMDGGLGPEPDEPAFIPE